MRVKMSKPTPPAPTASAIGPCPTVIKIVGRPGTGGVHVSQCQTCSQEDLSFRAKKIFIEVKKVIRISHQKE